MSQHVSVPADPSIQRTRTAGIAIATATIVSTIFVAMDKSGGGTNQLEILQGIANLQVLKEVVHGVAIASVCAYAFGFAVLAHRLGLRKPPVLAGLMAFLFGCVAMIGATILDGFVTTHVAMDAIGGSPEKVKFAYALICNIGIVLNDLAKLGWILQAAATLAWSYTLIRDGLGRVTGFVGLISSALVIALIAGSDTNMSMTSLLSVLVAQLIWNLAAGIFLMHDASCDAHPEKAHRHALA